MKISEWLQQATNKLESTGIGTARLDALILAEDATGHDRAYLLAHPNLDVRGPTFHKLDTQMNRRMEHEPMAYIRGKTEFYGREFVVDKRVLEPRPESETMIELALRIIGDRLQFTNKIHIIDVGTGSGALAITAKLELPSAEVIATDIDPKCLQVARKNAQKHTVDIKFHVGDLLETIYNLKPVTYNLILANLPYVPNSFTINEAAMREPKIAIFGGPDGLDLYRQLFKQLEQFKLKAHYILTESMPPQHDKLKQIAKKYGYKQTKDDDFIQLFEKI